MHAAALTKRGEALFSRFARFRGFYLVGGTALALHLGHRRSIDFDLFTAAELPLRLLQTVKRVFPETAVVVQYRAPGQLTVTIDEIKTTFFAYPYPVIGRLVRYRHVPLLTVPELAATKALAIGKRLSYKDYVDWYFLLKEKHVTIAEVIRFSKRKFGHDFNDRLFLGQLASVEDVREVPIAFLRDPVDRKTIQRFLGETIRRFAIG